ncbi:hypothetical protein C8R46DRAFT_1185552 [Mycena filopes]|nr:hypothetical protein C8R46DRAFT_1185552 [Mycena filopes]
MPTPSYRKSNSSPTKHAHSPVEYASANAPTPPGFTPPWLKGNNRVVDASPSPLPPLPYYALPPLEIISIVPQARLLHVAPPDEDRVLRDHVPRAKGTKPKGRPAKIAVVPAARPIAILTAHTPAPGSAVRPAHGGRGGGGEGSAPGTPYTPQSTDPELMTGLPRALGMQAFPTRAERPWRHGG